MKPELLLVSRMFAVVAPPALDEHFHVHRYHEAKDRQAMLAEVAPNIRAIATDGGVGASAELMDALPKLEIVACCSVGFDAVDLDYAARRGLLVTNTPDVLNDDVANMAVLLVLATSRTLVANDRWVREGKWLKGAPPLAHNIRGKTVGLLGLGRIGRDVAAKLEAFDCTIIYHTRRKVPDVSYRHYDDLVEMARASDHLVAIVPGGETTRHMVNRAVLDALGPEGTLINVARGSVVDEAALIAALQEGRLGGAGLDVFADEPRVPEALLAMDNVVLQPHQASATVETRRAMGQLTTDNLIAHFSGKPVLTPVL